MSANRDRAEAVARMLQEYEDITADFVAQKLHCGRGQALRAIRQGRMLRAPEGGLVSYANPHNGFKVNEDGDGIDRTRSWLARQKSINTQTRNAAIVMGAAIGRIDATTYERAVAKLAQAREKDAEADSIRLEVIRDLVASDGAP